MWRRLFPKSIASYVSALALGAAITIYVLVQNGFDVLLAYVSGMSSAGILLILFGLLLLVIHLGAGDGLAYSFRKARAFRQKDGMGEQLTRQSYWEYLQIKEQERKKKDWNFMAYVWVGVVFLAVGLFLELWLN